MSKENADKLIQDAMHAHTNLNTFALIVAILESGALYGPEIKTAAKIIALCNKETSRQLQIYDSNVNKYHEISGTKEHGL